jgi:hypothetical protein
MADYLAGTSLEKQSPFGWFLVPMKKYAVFRGRARRREFWSFVLFIFLIEFALSFAFALLTRGDEGVTQGVSALFLGILRCFRDVRTLKRRISTLPERRMRILRAAT